ncbi:WD40 repeat-like protein [Rozella allomycis CSF55]|uniref:Transcriptional repressor Tup1 domain-containing protein n=1 Tax=Rozella allomycis (strain CSF55) TaxID=988480 RepID=A0A075AQX0_ROZAC|nr:Transcriptional repressor Tup1 domain-containing protein [Rozella allomycis CSF55]RKP21066.1 WD40 repeat-like protein [Rozella allomycis CSF55]|eukprot:EPZ31075.1 Transcriptional repressor Tup1 domain-containing protein [Rozella allomycis CSF55]
MYGHRPAATTSASRFYELLDSLKQEYETSTQDLSVQRESFEHKVQSQINEIIQIQKNVYELERAHLKMKQQYEDEIFKLKKELEARGGDPAVTLKRPRLEESSSSVSLPSLPASNIQSNSVPPTFPVKPMVPKSQPQVVKALPDPKKSFFHNIDPSQVPTTHKKEGNDWNVIYNPNMPRKINIELHHSIDHLSVVCCVKFSDDAKFLATGCNKTTQIFDVETEDENAGEGDLYIRSVAFSKDGKFLATGAEDKAVRIWDLEEKTLKKIFHGHEQDIYSLEFSKDGRFVISGSGDRTARIWDVESGEAVHILSSDDGSQKEGGITSVAYSPDGTLIAAGSLDKTIRLWDAESGKPIDKLEGHKDSVYSVAFSPNGQMILSGSLDKTLKIWDLNSEIKDACKHTFEGHKDYVLSVAYSNDGMWAISGSKDRSVQFWDPQTAEMHAILQGHKNSVISVTQSPHGSLFATGSGDCRARIWSYEIIE